MFTVPKKEKEYENKLKYDDTTITDIKVRENALEEVFQNIFSIKNFDENLSKRKELTQTLIKVTLLNNYYSTRIKDDDLVAIARQIVNLGAHSRLNKSKKAEEPDCDLVNQIAYYRKDIKSGDKKINTAYSFATKYCSWHCHEWYPIADSYAKGFLYHLNEALKNNKQYKEKQFISYPDNGDTSKTAAAKILNDYNKYVELYELFKDSFDLKESDTKKIDEYIWRYTKKELTEEELKLKIIVQNQKYKKKGLKFPLKN